MITKKINGWIAYPYVANIRDGDSGKCYLPDYECFVAASIETDGHVEVDRVFLENAEFSGDYLDADSSLDKRVQNFATDIRSLAENDEEFCDMVREAEGFEYPKDDYASQHHLRACDVLPNRAF